MSKLYQLTAIYISIFVLCLLLAPSQASAVDLCEGVICDDGNACNGFETCDPATGNCIEGTPLSCDDGNLCTTDSCNPASGCENSSVVCGAGEACDPSTGVCAPSLTCIGSGIAMFDVPLDEPFTVNQRARVLPFSMMLVDEYGNALSDADIAPPLIEVNVAPGNINSAPPPESLDSAGRGDDGNQFTFNGNKWGFNLKTKNFSGAGKYTATVLSGEPLSYVIDPTCEGVFYIMR